jgi:hypothetical protein
MPFTVSRYEYALKSGNAYLHGEERLIGITRVPLEETREQVEVGARGIDPIELTCS